MKRYFFTKILKIDYFKRFFLFSQFLKLHLNQISRYILKDVLESMRVYDTKRQWELYGENKSLNANISDSS